MTNKQLMDIPGRNSTSKPRLKAVKSVPMLPPTTARRVELQKSHISNRIALRSVVINNDSMCNSSALSERTMNNGFQSEPEPYLEPVQIKASAKKVVSSASSFRKATPTEVKKTPTWSAATVPPPKIVVRSQLQRERQLTAEESEKNKSVADREAHLAYLVVDLQTGKPSFETTSFDDLDTVKNKSNPDHKFPTRSFTMSAADRPKLAPKPRLSGKDSLKDRASSSSTHGERVREAVGQLALKSGSPPQPAKPKPYVAKHTLSKLSSLPPTYGGHASKERVSLPNVSSDSALIKRLTIQEEPAIQSQGRVKPSEEAPRRHSFKVQSRRLEDSFGKDSVSSKESTSSREHSPCSDSLSSKQLSKHIPARPPPPSKAVLSKARTFKSRSPASSRQMSTSRQSNGSYYEDIDANLPSEETGLKMKAQGQTKRTSVSSVSSGVVSPSSLSETDKLTYPNDLNVYEEIDTGFPIPPPRKKKQSWKNKKSPCLQNRKLQKSDIGLPEPVTSAAARGAGGGGGGECSSAPLSRRSLPPSHTSPAPTGTPPPLPPKSSPKRSSLKRRALPKLPDNEAKLSCSENEDEYIDPSELSKVDFEEPDVGGTDEYVDMDSLSAWNPDTCSFERKSSVTTSAASAELLASDNSKPDDMYVEMHPAVSKGLDENEEEEEPVYVEMDPTVFIPPPSPPTSVHYASKDLLAKRPDLKHTKSKRKTSSKSK